jgi:signal transduction histidine kinase
MLTAPAYQMARRLLYNRLVVLKPLSWQLGLVMLLVAVVPLAGAGFFTLTLLERSVSSQIRSHQEQLALAAGALVRTYIKEGQTRLKLIASRIAESKNPEELARQLDGQMDPPGMLLEISVVAVKENPEVIAQSQQRDYNKLLNDNATNNRSYNPKLRQQVTVWNNNMGNIDVPLKGGEYASDQLETVKNVPALPISVPVSDHRILTANLDFRPLSTILKSMAGPSGRWVLLQDAQRHTIAQAGEIDADSAIRIARGEEHVDFLSSRIPVGHGKWTIDVSELSWIALEPLRVARRQAYVWFGLATIMALGLAALFARKVVRPVETLSRAAHRLAGGDLTARSGIQRDDEIGQLARAFDRMAGSVQQLDQMKGDFVAHVSHELRTPLTSAKVTLANVQEGISGKESLGRVQEDLDRLIRMVNELLDVARIEAGITLAKQPTDLGGLTRSTVESLRPLAKVELSVSGSGDTLPLDAARVQQILVNLVDNALKYAKSRVDVLIQGREVRVSDDGPGVAPEHRERIFEKFSRVETGPKPPGAGLGLSIARKLAQLHGGSLVCLGNSFVLRF